MADDNTWTFKVHNMMAIGPVVFWGNGQYIGFSGGQGTSYESEPEAVVTEATGILRSIYGNYDLEGVRLLQPSSSLWFQKESSSAQEVLLLQDWGIESQEANSVKTPPAGRMELPDVPTR